MLTSVCVASGNAVDVVSALSASTRLPSRGGGGGGEEIGSVSTVFVVPFTSKCLQSSRSPKKSKNCEIHATAAVNDFGVADHIRLLDHRRRDHIARRADSPIGATRRHARARVPSDCSTVNWDRMDSHGHDHIDMRK